MATYNLRRFAQPDGLKAIAPEHLLALLKPHEPYFRKRGLMLLSISDSDHIDYDRLVELLMTPDSDTPTDLVDALFLVHEMATPQRMDILLQEMEDNGLALADNTDPTPADIAVQAYLKNKDILERKHAEQFLVRPRSFEYYQTEEQPIPEFKEPSAEVLMALESDLDDWFETKKRGRGSKVFFFPKDDSIWFLVRHGDPYKREGSLEGGQQSSVFYRPEKYDVLIYETAIGEIRMNACNKGEKDTLRRKFGRHFFGDEDFFPSGAKYSLQPLQTNGESSIICTDVEGMEWVRLKELQFDWHGVEKEIEIRKANDLFAAYTSRDQDIPENAHIIRASFLVKFRDSKTARTVTIKPSNIALYTRDSDASIIEEWLMKRGFITSNHQQDEV